MEPGQRLRAAREAIGLTVEQLALRVGFAPTTVRAHENGQNRLRPLVASAYATALGKTPEWLLFGAGKAAAAGVREESTPFTHAGALRDIARVIPVVGEVAAGVWRETAVAEAWEIAEYLPLDVLGYERADLKAMRVVGASMNRIYPPGRYVIVAPPAEAGLRMDDIVVVERCRKGLYEITLKQFTVEADGRRALWPRSDDPRYQTPIYLQDETDDQDSPSIIGIVVADFGRAVRPMANPPV